MRLLLDTNAMLWMLGDAERLSRAAADAIDDEDNDLIISSVSVLEAAIKVSQGKLRLDYELVDTLIGLRCRFLEVSPAHAWAVSTLPNIHRDPFDRLIVAQAMIEGLVLVSSDQVLPLYGVETIRT